MKTINKKTICIFSFLVALIFSLSAERINFSAEIMTGKTGGKNATTSLQGNAYIKTSSMEIRSDYIELSGDDYRYIKAEGGVKGSSIESKMDFTCDSLTYDRITKIANLEGNVKLIDSANDVKAQAQTIEYNQETEVAILQIKVNLTQKNNICTAAYAIYQKKSQLLELSGNAQVKQGEDTFRAQLITLNMETQDITLDGNVKGSITETGKGSENSEPPKKNAAVPDMNMPSADDFLQYDDEPEDESDLLIEKHRQE